MSCRLVLGCVSVLIGIVASLPAQGLIPFTPPICTTLPAGFVLYRDSADFDGDGDLDLLGRPVTQSSTIQVLLQDQNGQLQLGPSSASSAVSNMHASFGDLNGDGFMDVCTFSTNGGLSFLFQTPSGFNRVDRAAPFVNINQLQILDWNGDGSPDIVLGRKQVLINAGNGSFPTQVTIGPPSYIGDGFTDFVDLDGDGDFDILQTNGNPALSIAGAFPFTVHLADPSGALTSQTLITETALSMAMGSGDFDGDGDGDLVQIGEFPGSGGGAEIRLRTWLRDPAGNYAPGAWQGVVNVTSSPLAVSGWPLAIVDFDGDGFDDIAVLFAEAFQWQVKIYRGSPSGFLAPAQVQSTAVDNNFIYMADFDQDGRQDLGWAGQSGFCRALNLSSTTMRPETLVNTGPLHRHGWAPATWTRPHVLKVAVTSTGTPVPNRVLTITELPASGNPITTTVTTDAQGLATVSAVSSNQMGTGTLIIQSATTNALALPYHRRRFQVTLNLNPPVGLPFIAVQLEHAGALPLPFTLAVDVPLPPPGALFTPFGDINTSLLARGPAFAAIDGLGLFGIPNPTAIADPNYFQVFPITSAIPPGTVAIVQAYARDFSLPFLDGIVISPAATLLF